MNAGSKFGSSVSNPSETKKTNEQLSDLRSEITALKSDAK
jgi:hypothetical protein